MIELKLVFTTPEMISYRDFAGMPEFVAGESGNGSEEEECMGIPGDE